MPDTLTNLVEKCEQAANYRIKGLMAINSLYFSLSDTDEKTRILFGLLETIHGRMEDSHILLDLKGCSGTATLGVEDAWTFLSRGIVESCRKWASYFSHENIVTDESKKASAFRALLCGLTVVNLSFKPGDARILETSGLMDLLFQTSKCSDTILR